MFSREILVPKNDVGYPDGHEDNKKYSLTSVAETVFSSEVVPLSKIFL
jgi:hypothetical protein